MPKSTGTQSLFSWLFLTFVLSGCGQSGTVVMENRTPFEFEGDVSEGGAVLIAPLKSQRVEVDLGRDWTIFGTHSAEVTIRGENNCVRPFRESVEVEEGETVRYPILGDAAYIEACNDVGTRLNVYLSPCADESWGAPDGEVDDGSCLGWRVDTGCWDLRVDNEGGAGEIYGIELGRCGRAQYTFYSEAAARPGVLRYRSREEFVAADPLRDGIQDVGAHPTGPGAGDLLLTMPKARVR